MGKDLGTEMSVTATRSFSAGQLAEAPRLESLRCIVLAGVHAWGNCPLEEVVARPLLPVAEQPLILHILRWVGAEGVRHSTICGNGDTKVLRRRLGGSVEGDVALHYCEDAVPRGPAGCARDAAMHCDADLFVVVDGTILPRIDLQSMLDEHVRQGAVLTIAAVAPSSGSVDASVTPAGLYLISRSALEHVPATGYQDIKETLIPKLYQLRQPVAIHKVPTGSVRQVYDAASYLSVNLWAVESMLSGSAPQGYRQVGESWVHETAEIADTARLVGPVLVGPGVVVESGALVVGPGTVGARSRVCRDAVVSYSAVWSDCQVNCGAIVDHCVLTDGAVVEADEVYRETVRTGGWGVGSWGGSRILDRIKSKRWPSLSKSRMLQSAGGTTNSR